MQWFEKEECKGWTPDTPEKAKEVGTENIFAPDPQVLERVLEALRKAGEK